MPIRLVVVLGLLMPLTPRIMANWPLSGEGF